MNLHKINNFAFTLALALGLAGASALSSLYVVQAKTLPDPTVRGQGYQQRYYAPQRYYRQRYYAPQQGQQPRYVVPQQGYQQRYVVPQQPQQTIPAPMIAIPPGSAGMQDPIQQGIYWGREDGQAGAEFRPCMHQEYMNGDKYFRRAFINGYSQGYFTYNP